MRYRLSKHKMTIDILNIWGAWPVGPKGPTSYGDILQ